MTRENKSFRTYARKHLADKIKQRRVTAQGRKEMKERIEKKEIRNAKKAKKADQQHAEDVAKLHETDPELYAFLEEEDPTLLQYGQVSAEDDIFDGVEGSDDETDADDDAEEDGEDAAPAAKKSGKKGEAAEGEEEEDPLRKRVTRAEIDETLATDNKKIAPMISLFVSAARELNVKDLKPEPPHLGGCRKFADFALVKETLATAAKRIAALAPSALFSTVTAAPAATEGDDKKAAAGKKKGKKGDKKGKKNSNSNAGFVSTTAKGLTKRFLLAAAAVLSDAAQSDVALGAIVARALHPFVRVFHMIQGATKGVLRSCLALCACTQESARVAGYMVVLAVAKRAAGTHSLYQSAVFKGIFLTLIRAVHNYTARSLSVVSFLLNAVCDLYGTDLEAAYQHAFVYIRQLAVFLRAALQNPSQISSVRAVCNWQFVTALRTWALVASTYHEPKQLGPLIHPVVQIALGTIDLFASPRLVPLHLHVIETLNHLASRAHVFIPVAPHLLRILTSPSLALDRTATRAANAAAAALAKKKGGANRKKGDDEEEDEGHGGAAAANASFTDLQFMLRVKKAIAKTTEYKVNVWVEALYHLTEHLATLSCSFGFPEATWAVTSTLSKLRHDVKAPRLHATLTNLLRAVNQTTQLVESKRAAAAFGPSDTAQVKMAEDELRAAGTALTKYYQAQRQQRIADFAAKQRALQANSDSTTLEAAAAAAMKKKKAGKRREREESSDDE